MFIPVKTLPDAVKDALRDINYGRADIKVCVSDTVTPYSQGGGGTKGIVVGVNLEPGGTVVSYEGDWGGAGFGCSPIDWNTTEYPLKPNNAIIKGTVGYGGTRATLHLHPSNWAKFLPEASSVSDREKKVLKQFWGLTKAGRESEWEYDPASRPTDEELNDLVTRDLLSRNKTGAMKITTEGKNAAGI